MSDKIDVIITIPSDTPIQRLQELPDWVEAVQIGGQQVDLSDTPWDRGELGCDEQYVAPADPSDCK